MVRFTSIHDNKLMGSKKFVALDMIIEIPLPCRKHEVVQYMSASSDYITLHTEDPDILKKGKFGENDPLKHNYLVE